MIVSYMVAAAGFAKGLLLGAALALQALCLSPVREAAMIIRQTLNFGANLVAGAIVGAIAVVAVGTALPIRLTGRK